MKKCFECKTDLNEYNHVIFECVNLCLRCFKLWRLKGEEPDSLPENSKITEADLI